MLDDAGSGGGHDVDEFLGYCAQSLPELTDLAAVFLVDSAGHGVEVVADGLEAERRAEVDQPEVCLRCEEVDDQLGLFLHDFIHLLQGADLCVDATVLGSSVMASTRCCTKALL